MADNTDQQKASISQKESLNLNDVNVVQNYWNHANHGHFNMELYEKILRAKENTQCKKN